jgi:hypothetical protein
VTTREGGRPLDEGGPPPARLVRLTPPLVGPTRGDASGDVTIPSVPIALSLDGEGAGLPVGLYKFYAYPDGAAQASSVVTAYVFDGADSLVALLPNQ